MKAGRGKAKGNSFELQTCKQLSLWVSQGQRADLFARNVLSGGRFTSAKKAGQETSIPGDLMANSPLAYEFLSVFSIECKHWKSLALESYLFDVKGTSALAKIIQHCIADCAHARTHWLLIARQNRKPTMIFFSGTLVSVFQPRPQKQKRMRINTTITKHLLHEGRVVMMPLESFLRGVNANAFVQQAKIQLGD